MAKVRVKSPQGGYSQNAGIKIGEVNRGQGVHGIDKMQATTRVIYDAVQLATTTTNTTIRLFEGAKTRQFPLTNLSENKLQVGESIAMQRFSIFIMQCTTGTTNCIGISPLMYWPNFTRLYGGQLNFNIAQDQVIKKLPLSAMFSCFNPHSRFIGYYQIQVAATDPVTSFLLPQDIYTFQNNIVIPPQIEFYADITIPPISSLPAGFDSYLMMKIEGLGSLYAPKANY